MNINIKTIQGVLFYIYKNFIYSHIQHRIVERYIGDELPSMTAKTAVCSRNLNEHDISLLNGRFRNKKILMYLSRLRKGYKAFGIFTESGNIAGIGWTARGFDPDKKIQIKVQPGEAMLLDDYVFEEYRGNGIHSFLIAQRLKYLKDTGIHKAYAAYEVNNEISRRAYLKNGFVEVAETRTVKLLGFTVVFRKCLTEKKCKTISRFSWVPSYILIDIITSAEAAFWI